MKTGQSLLDMEVTCLNCGWVHMAVTREHAEEQIQLFRAHYDKMSYEDQGMYCHNPPTLATYTGCNFCGKSKFRPFKDGDCPTGCTIGPVIYEDDPGVVHNP